MSCRRNKFGAPSIYAGLHRCSDLGGEKLILIGWHYGVMRPKLKAKHMPREMITYQRLRAALVVPVAARNIAGTPLS